MSDAGGPDDDPRSVANALANALRWLDRIEASAARAQAPHGEWNPAVARRFVPAFAVWLEQASFVLSRLRWCRRHDFNVPQSHEFIHRYNLAKMLGREFETTVEVFLDRQTSQRRGIPLDDIANELRRRGFN